MENSSQVPPSKGGPSGKDPSSESIPDATFDELISLLQAKPQKPKENDAVCKFIRDKVQPDQASGVPPLKLEVTEKLKEAINAVSNWILANSSSENLTTVCSLLLAILQNVGHNHEFDINSKLGGSPHANTYPEIFEEEIELIESLGDEEAKEDREQIEKLDQKHKLLTSALASAILSLFVSLLNKQNPLKYKSFLVVLIKCSSYLMSVDNYRRSYRKQGAIKSMIRLIKEVLTSQSQNQKQGQIQKEYMDLISYIINYFSNFIYANRKNREYFILKGGVSLTAKFIDKNYPIFYGNDRLMKACCSVLGNVAVTNDNKILLWVLGAIPNLIQIVLDKVGAQGADQVGTTAAEGLQQAEFAMYVLWKASIDCEDVQEELMKRNFIEVVLKIVKNISHNVNLIAFGLAVIRRLASNQKYRDEVAKNFLLTLMTFIKIFYESQSKEGDKALTYHQKLGISFIYKEILGCLGVLAADEKHRLLIVDNEGIYYVIMSARININKPKIIKTGLGCLINLASSPDNKDIIAKDASYYQLVYTVLESYDDMTPLVDFTLRLILNTSDHKVAFQNYISGSIFKKLLKYLSKHIKNANIIWSSVQILRLLCSTQKATNNFKKALQEHYQVEDLTVAFDKFIEVLVACFEAHLQTVQIFTDIILFLSYLTKSVEEVQTYIKQDKRLVPAIQKYIAHHQKDENIIQLLSECVAYLPIEDLVLVPGE